MGNRYDPQSQGLRVGFFDQDAFKRKEHLTLVLRTGVAGMRQREFTDEEKKLVENIEFGTELRLVREPENEFDKWAIKVLTIDGLMLGYVTKYKNEMIARLMDEGRRFVAYTRDPSKEEDGSDKPVKEDRAPTEMGLAYNIFLVEE